MSDRLVRIDLKQIKKRVNLREGIHMGDDFFVIEVKSGQGLGFLNYPFRADAYFAVFCVEGSLDVEINLIKYTMKSHSLLICLPGNILRVVDPISEKTSNGRFIVVAISKEYLSEISIDYKKVQEEQIILFSAPCVSLNEKEMDFFRKYLTLFKEIMDAGILSVEYAVGSLISSLFYVISGLMQKAGVRTTDSIPKSGSNVRLRFLYENFMKLVTEYHMEERGMSFYAERLGLTPKYLSKLVKQYSGRSAPDWIDSFVVLEAKNLLKYTGDSIKEIVYKLHFPNPSVFYKYFKAHTGMTPSEYRNS